MTWKLWIVVVLMGVGLLANLGDLWSPKDKFRDEDDTRRLAVIAIIFQVFILYAILSVNTATTKCFVE